MEHIEYVSGIVLGLVAVAKVAGLKSNYLPLLGVVIGIGLSYAIPEVTFVTGIVGALTASGLYSGAKATVK